MRRSLVCAITIGVVTSWALPVFASVTATITDAYGDPNSVSVLPGSFFTVVVELDTTESLVSGQLMIQADAPDVFTLESVSFDNVVWSNDPADVLDPTPQTLNAGNSNTSGDIGTLAVDLVNGTGTGVIDFATIQVSVDENTLPATYTLDVVDSIFGNTDFEDIIGSSGVSYEVYVIPAPGAVVLGLIGLGVVGWLKKRFLPCRPD